MSTNPSQKGLVDIYLSIQLRFSYAPQRFTLAIWLGLLLGFLCFFFFLDSCHSLYPTQTAQHWPQADPRSLSSLIRTELILRAFLSCPRNSSLPFLIWIATRIGKCSAFSYTQLILPHIFPLTVVDCSMPFHTYIQCTHSPASDVVDNQRICKNYLQVMSINKPREMVRAPLPRLYNPPTMPMHRN